jgi:hypothetical protein
MNIEKYEAKMFEEIRHLDDLGNEYWEARELQEMLGYNEWRWFSNVIEKAQIACLQSNNDVNCHFGVYSKIVKAGVSSKSIIDYMGSAELVANEFRIVQTEELLSRQKEKSEKLASDTHFMVGKTVREAIEKLGNTMPENLPTPKKSIKELEKEELKRIK